MGRKIHWLPLESNPEVMLQHSSKLGGPPNIQFVDIYTTESWGLELVPRPVYAIMLLYPLPENEEDEKKASQSEVNATIPPDVWFIKQTVSNSCGTIGLLHAIMNMHEDIPCARGGYLEQFYENVKGLSAHERAQVFENDESIEASHKASISSGQSDIPREEDDVKLHFITFTCKNGKLYQLDGRKSAPIFLKNTTRQTFLEDTCSFIRESFMAKNPEDLRFSMVAICGPKQEQGGYQ